MENKNDKRGLPTGSFRLFEVKQIQNSCFFCKNS